MNGPLLQNSLLVAGLTTLFAIGFGVIAALWLAALAKRWRNVFLALAIIALALPPFLVTNCWLDLLGETGVWRAWLPLNIFSLGGTVWILSLMFWPITALLVLSGWRRLEAPQLECDPALTDFALVRVLLLPMARGELALAALVTFVLALNNFAVPAILQTKVLPDEMWIQFNTTFFLKPDDTFDLLRLTRVSAPLVIAPLVMLVFFWRRGIAWPRLQGAVPARVFRQQIGIGWVWSSGFVVLVLLTLSVGLPLAQIVSAGRTWSELPGAVEAGTSAIWNSFWWAALAATLVIILSLIVLPASCRQNKPRWPCRQDAGSTFLWLPFFMPGVLLGITLIWIFNRPPFLDFYRSAGIVVLAFVIRYFALGWSGARHALESVDSDLTDAARLEGASRSQMLRHVLWPQIAAPVLVAAYVVYLLCLWDVESMILVVPPGGETLALRIFNLLHYGHNAQVNALCLTLLGLAVLPLLIWCCWKASNIQRITKHQAPNTKKPSSSKLQTATTGRSVGVLCFQFVWCLVFGVWVCTGCSRQTSSNEAHLQSRFFERAEVIGQRGVGIGEFNKPRSVAVDREDNVYAVDMTARVQKFSPDGRFLLSWQMPQTDKGKPKGMCRDGDGNIVVVEPHYSRVNHFTTDGKLVLQWGERGTNGGQFGQPRAAAVNSRGEIFVSEFSPTERLQQFARPSTQTTLPSNGRGEQQSVGPPLMRVVGKSGTATGEFNRAEGICMDAQDQVYVADSCNHRIQIFSSDGKFIRQYGRAGSGLGELSYPYDIAVDARGNQFVCEFGNSRIQVFDANCQPIEIIGGPGAEPGRFANPWGVALDSHENLYVADSQNHRVQKLMRRKGSTGPMAETHAARITDLGRQ